MKKFFVLLLTLTLVLGLMVGCSEDDTGGTSKKTANAAQEIKGEMYDAGNVKVLVPEGWKAFPVKDVLADEPDTVDPDALTICKGGETDLDLFAKPYIRVDFYGPDTEMLGGLQEFYEDTEELEPIQAGEHTWEGFTTTDYGLMAVLTAKEGQLQYQVSIILEASGEKITLEDADVLAILESIAAS